MGKKRITIDDAIREAQQRGGLCLSPEVPSSKHLLEWQCKLGHTWEQSYNNVSSKDSWCPDCSKYGKNQRLLHATIEQIFQTSFQRNVRPDWLISPDGNKMELDGYSEQLQIAFEYNGEQHYNKKHMFYRESHDALKKQICASRGIALIVVSYKTKRQNFAAIIKAQCEQAGMDCSKYKFNRKIDLSDAYSPSHIEELEGIAFDRGGTMISREYFTANTKYEFVCELGHEFEMTAVAVKQGSWCKECGIAESKRKRSKSLFEVQAALEDKKIKILNPEEYESAGSCLKYKCGVCSNVWDGVVANLIKGGNCPVCARASQHKRRKGNAGSKYLISDLQKMALEWGGSLLSEEYSRSDDTYEWRCAEGHIFKRRWDKMQEAIQRGRFCPKCTVESTKGSIENLMPYLEKGTKILSEYSHSKEKILLMCPRGAEYSMTPNLIKRGLRCNCHKCKEFRRKRKSD